MVCVTNEVNMSVKSTYRFVTGYLRVLVMVIMGNGTCIRIDKSAAATFLPVFDPPGVSSRRLHQLNYFFGEG